MTEVIRSALKEPGPTMVAAFFDPNGPFAANTFDDLGDNCVNSVGIDDLLAITTLDVALPPRTIRLILGRDQEKINEMLGGISAETELWEAGDPLLGRASALWRLLDQYGGIGPVKAGKILARKRPALIPIIDSVVREALPAPEGHLAFWQALRTCLSDSELRREIDSLRPQNSGGRITTLRLLDVVIWMRFSDGRNARKIQKRLGLDVKPRP